MTMDHKPNNEKYGRLKSAAIFIIFSIVVAFIGWALGTFDAGQDTDGWVEQIYHSPGESRRPY